MAKFTMNMADFRNRVLGCWLGKNIGGTLGMPYEWKRQINDITYYTQKLDGEPAPNDDLDIQLVWLLALEDFGPSVSPHQLASYWQRFQLVNWAEYGTATANLTHGMPPPLCGTYKNDYKHSCGSFIRSEIWACAAPGMPHLAVEYAISDSIIDHGDGEGTWAEVFTAAMESAAFFVHDLAELIEIGQSYLPVDCAIWQAVQMAKDDFKAGMPWQRARDHQLEKFCSLCGGHLNLTYGISKEDLAKGFDKGRDGYDAPSNIGMLAIAMLYGGGDFDKTICMAVNCGEDTDCTAATVGSILGIIMGADKIPEKWITPIGRKIVTICVNLSERGGLIPRTVDQLTDRVVKVAQRVVACPGSHVELSHDQRTELTDLSSGMVRGDAGKSQAHRIAMPVYNFDFANLAVNYLGDPSIKPGQPKKIRLELRSKWDIQEVFSLRWILPEGWHVSPSPVVTLSCNVWPRRTVAIADFELVCDRIDTPLARIPVEITSLRRPHEVMLAPVTLVPAPGESTDK